VPAAAQGWVPRVDPLSAVVVAPSPALIAQRRYQSFLQPVSPERRRVPSRRLANGRRAKSPPAPKPLALQALLLQAGRTCGFCSPLPVSGAMLLLRLLLLLLLLPHLPPGLHSLAATVHLAGRG